MIEKRIYYVRPRDRTIITYFIFFSNRALITVTTILKTEEINLLAMKKLMK